MTIHIKILKMYFEEYTSNLDFINYKYKIEKKMIDEKYLNVSSFDYSKIKNQPNYYNNDNLNSYSDEVEILNKKRSVALERLTLVNDLIEDVFDINYDLNNKEIYDIFNLRYRCGVGISEIAEKLNYDDYQEQNIYKKINAGFKKISQVLTQSTFPLNSYDNYSDKIKHIRKNTLLLTQQQMAEKLNLSREHYNRIEKGVSEPTEDIVYLVDSTEKDQEKENITFFYNIRT